VLNVTIQVNAPLLKPVYRAPFCGSTPIIYKFNMHEQLKKEKLEKKIKMFHTSFLLNPCGSIDQIFIMLF
jgi:hypothetical protein